MSRYSVFFVRPSADSLLDLRREVRRLLRRHVSSSVGYDVLLALEEAVTNALAYGSGNDIVVHVGLQADRVTATVRDAGAGFDVQQLVSTWPPPQSAEGGRGIYIMTRLMDSVTVLASGPTIVHMSRLLDRVHDRQDPVCVWSSPALARFSHV